MTALQKTLTQLLQPRPVRANVQDIYLSLYIQTENQQKNELQKKIKSLLQSELKSHANLEEKLSEEIISNTLSKLNKVEFNSPGMAIYVYSAVKRSSKKPARLKKISLKHFELTQAPRNKAQLSNHFELDQLLTNQDGEAKAIAVVMELDKACVYEYQNGSISFLKKVENGRLKNIDNRNGGPRTQDKSQFGWFSSNEHKNWLQEETKHFMDDVAASLSDLNTEQALIVFHSNNFTKYLKGEKNPFTKLSKNLSCEEKVIKESNRVQAEVAILMEKNKHSKKIALLDKAQSRYQKFTSGWQQVCEAATNAKISQLFIRENMTIPGYVDSNGQVYLEKRENTFRVSNIIPWLVKSVVSFGGDVIVFTEQELLSQKPTLAASLRF